MGLKVANAAAPLAATLMLLAPALWNGFPLLEYDTGGYLARWFEGTLEVSRSTVYGLFLALLGVAAYSLYAWLYLEVVPGWTSIMISIIVVSFFQLIALSVIGEYVGRIYMSTKHRPLFIIDAIERKTAE